MRRRQGLLLVIVAAVLIGVGLPVAAMMKQSHTATSEEQFITYVRVYIGTGDETDADILRLGRMSCQTRDKYPSQIIVESIEREIPNAGERIYDGANRYLCP